MWFAQWGAGKPKCWTLNDVGKIQTDTTVLPRRQLTKKKEKLTLTIIFSLWNCFITFFPFKNCHSTSHDIFLVKNIKTTLTLVFPKNSLYSFNSLWFLNKSAAQNCYHEYFLVIRRFGNLRFCGFVPSPSPYNSWVLIEAR